jgi:aminopeptidase N
MRRITPIASWLLWSATVPLATASPTRQYTVENYDVSLRPDLAKQLLYGEVAIRLHSQADISALEFDAGGLQITSVKEGQFPRSFERNRGKLFVAFTNSLRPDDPHTITVVYQAGPAAGLKFFPDQIYTSVTSDWMPCNDDPSERATLHLTISAPPNTNAAASGQMTATRAVEGQTITEWQLNSPAEPNWFGFALGVFSENTSEAGGVKLRVLGAGTEIFEPTAAAMHDLAERTGKTYPGQIYTQVFTHGDVTRAMAGGLTLLPESYARKLEKKPDDPQILAAELAHQWYGITIATKTWSDLWLSDGISAYLADLFLEKRFGKDSYQREIDRSRLIYNQLRAAGKDRALSDTGAMTRQEAEGEILAHKGVYFLYLINQVVGDTAFGEGLRLYTSGQWGHEATSEDLQKAFDAVNTAGRAKGRKSNSKNGPNTLDNLFDMWVFGIASPKSK